MSTIAARIASQNARRARQAREAFDRNAEALDAMIKLAAATLDAEKARAEAGGKVDWGHVGNLSGAAEKLALALLDLGAEGAEEIAEAMGIDY